MARTNLRKTRAGLQELAAMATQQWEAERKIDRDHIAAHIQQTREDMDWIVAWEAQLVDYVRTTASQMRDRILERQRSLQGHLDDIKDDGGAEIETMPAKQINGSKA